MKTVYIVRHGQSTTNARTTDVCVDDADVELTRLGEEQSRFIAERAKNLPIEVVISSTYRRARDTAAMIAAATGAPVEYSEVFVERKIPASLIGKPFHAEETERIYRTWVRAFYDPDARPKDGEHFFDIQARAKNALRLLEARPEQHIMVVSHGMFLRALAATILFGDALTPSMFRDFAAGTTTNNTGITLLMHGKNPHHDVDGDTERWRVRAFNDHAHLG